MVPLLSDTMEFLTCGVAGGDGAGCFKINPQLEREKVIFHNDAGKWVKIWNQQPDGVGHFHSTLTRDKERRRRPTSSTTFTESKPIHGYDGAAGLLRRTSTWQDSGNGFDRSKAIFYKDHDAYGRPPKKVAGVPQGRHDYYPFGHEVGRFGQVDEEIVKFTGHQRDAHGLSGNSQEMPALRKCRVKQAEGPSQ